jgi:dephospho-CoA kinase
MEKIYREGHPIVLGLAGRAGSGKTSVAEALCPKGAVQTSTSNILWEHIFHALPLYELASIKKNIQGSNAESRKLFAIHEVLFEIYGKSAIGHIPPYQKFVDKVRDIYNLPIEPEDMKPRTFLQKAGDTCREDYQDCFCHWVVLKSNELYKKNRLSLAQEKIERDIPVCIIVSDVRFINEAQAILKQPNGVLITFEASDETLKDRILKRDGVVMTDEQANHKSEKEIELLKDLSTYIINTDSMSIEEQARATLDLINNHVNLVGA